MEKIYGVWHCCVAGPSWENILYSQIDLLESSKLIDNTSRLFVHIVFDNRFLQNADKLYKLSFFLRPNVTLLCSLNLHDFEYPALKIVYDLANIGSHHSPSEMQPYSNVHHPFKLYYMHSKGFLSGDFQRRNPAVLWKEYMEYFNIERWEDCVKALDDYDICGVEWRERPKMHFSGNFWWARSKYLQKLPNILDYWSNNKFERLMAEMYIGLSNPKYKDFCNFGKDMYFIPIYRNMYQKEK